MLASARVSDATSKAWRYREHAITRRHNYRRAACAYAWAYYYSASVFPVVAKPQSSRRLYSSVISFAFFSDGKQPGALTSDEDANGSAQISPASLNPFTILRIEPIGNNSRRIVVAIPIDAPLEALWSVLTDYEHLADFIPGLAVCKIEDRWENGARLFQIGEQNLALGLKFKAKGVINVQELPIEFLSHGICRRIDFEMIEGDFQIFKGTWQMEQVVLESDDGLNATDDAAVVALRRGTLLTYVLEVQPKIWLPVGLVEGILSKEIQNNLVSIRDQVMKIHTSLSA